MLFYFKLYIVKPYTLGGRTVKRPVQDPLAVLLLANRLYMLLYDLRICKIKFILGGERVHDESVWCATYG